MGGTWKNHAEISKKFGEKPKKNVVQFVFNPFFTLGLFPRIKNDFNFLHDVKHLEINLLFSTLHLCKINRCPAMKF